jgi:hypothetical protein
MITDVKEIQQTLINLLKDHSSVLKITANKPDKFEVSGTVEAMQGKKKVDGIYFSTVVPKPKDVRFYFFPTYTHADHLVPNMPDNLKKCLKGKSCFHIKKLDSDLKQNIADLINTAVDLYKKDGLLA